MGNKKEPASLIYKLLEIKVAVVPTDSCYVHMKPFNFGNGRDRFVRDFVFLHSMEHIIWFSLFFAGGKNSV